MIDEEVDKENGPITDQLNSTFSIEYCQRSYHKIFIIAIEVGQGD